MASPNQVLKGVTFGPGDGYTGTYVPPKTVYYVNMTGTVLHLKNSKGKVIAFKNGVYTTNVWYARYVRKNGLTRIPSK